MGTAFYKVATLYVDVLFTYLGNTPTKRKFTNASARGYRIASQTVPESCVVHREMRDEALTGEPAGQSLSRESLKLVSGC
jgi:hypothetical protein